MGLQHGGNERFPADSTVNQHFRDAAFWSQLVGTELGKSAKKPFLYVDLYGKRRRAQIFLPKKGIGVKLLLSKSAIV